MPMWAPIPAESPPEPAPRELLGEHRVVHVVAALAAVLLRVLEAEVAELGHAREHVVGEPLGVLPLVRVGAQLLGHEAPDRLAQLLVLVRERRDRRRSQAASSASRTRRAAPCAAAPCPRASSGSRRSRPRRPPSGRGLPAWACGARSGSGSRLGRLLERAPRAARARSRRPRASRTSRTAATPWRRPRRRPPGPSATPARAAACARPGSGTPVVGEGRDRGLADAHLREQLLDVVEVGRRDRSRPPPSAPWRRRA